MSVYIIASLGRSSHAESRDATMLDAQRLLRSNYGGALEGMERRKLDLVAGGPAFVDLTDIKGMHLGKVFRAKQVIDLWWRVKGRTYQPGSGYEEWVWQSVFEYVRISGQGGRAWRVLVN